MLLLPVPACLENAGELIPDAPMQALDYGVAETNIWGIRMGFSGFVSQKHKPIVLTRQASVMGMAGRRCSLQPGSAQD
jgi:hypothetical protein